MSPRKKIWRESLSLRGRDSEALFLLGRTYEKLGRVEESQKLIAQATRLSQRVERWLNQPLPKLERFVTTTSFRTHEEYGTISGLPGALEARVYPRGWMQSKAIWTRIFSVKRCANCAT